MGRDRERRRMAALGRIWTERVRQRVPDAVYLDPNNRELQSLLEDGIVTIDQCMEAQERGAIFYSPALGAFIDLASAGPGETPDIP